MQEKRKPIKRKGKQPHKKLNMKDAKKSTGNNSVLKPKKKTAEPNYAEKQTKTTLNQRINDFKSSGFTLLNGKKTDEKRKMRKGRIISAAVAVVVLLSVVYLFVNSPTGVVEYINSKIALMKSGESFPASYDFSTGKSIAYSNGSLLVVTENELKCYNKTGNLIYSRAHGFADPIIKTSEIRTLIYGLNEAHYRIETPEKEVISKKTEDNKPIISADISDCGVYAIATEADEDIALVTAFNKDGNEIYKYHSSNNYITGVTVSSNGKKLCIVSLSTKKAEFVSKISVFNLDSTEPIFEKELDGEVVYNVEYTSDDDVCVITDKSYMNIDNDQISTEIKYNPEFLNKYKITEDYIVLYNTADSNSLNGTVTVLSKDGSIEASFEIEGSISDISVYDDSVFTLSESVNEYSFDGNKIKTTEIKKGAVKISSFSKGTAVLYSSGVDLVE